jgi:hypothetical protein
MEAIKDTLWKKKAPWMVSILVFAFFFKSTRYFYYFLHIGSVFTSSISTILDLFSFSYTCSDCLSDIIRVSIYEPAFLSYILSCIIYLFSVNLNGSIGELHALFYFQIKKVLLHQYFIALSCPILRIERKKEKTIKLFLFFYHSILSFIVQIRFTH